VSRRLAPILAVVAAAACSGVVAPVARTAAPVALPEVARVGAPEAGLPARPTIQEPAETWVRDPILGSPLAEDPEFRRAVDRWITYWTTDARPWFPDFLRRMDELRAPVDSMLEERELPWSLRYLPLIESGYYPGARSRASAVGMWQFMAGTASQLGLEVGRFRDERRDPFRATRAAGVFLDELHDAFGSWVIALAAYNGGPSRARRILSRHGGEGPWDDRLFWELRHRWPRETQEFVPKLVAAVIVAERAHEFGYVDRPAGRPLLFEEVEVPDATTFDVLARVARADEAEIRRLNPQFLRGFTPPGRTVAVRVPEGSADGFAERYAAIPPSERRSLVEHQIESGETLSHVAQRYGVSVADLRAANPEVRPRFLRVGSLLTVPVARPTGD
jgi:membrane-bound lytic murein transglycosylase D